MHDTQIVGIPCTVELAYIPANRGSREAGSGFQLEPDEPAFYEIINVFKLGGIGNPMAWLEAKLTDEDRGRISQEAMED